MTTKIPEWVSELYSAVPPQGRVALVGTGVGLALEASRQVLPVPSTWAARKIVRYYGDLPWVTEPFAEAVVALAKRLRVDPFSLTNLMYFESGLNPGAVNRSSGASGLIQFMPSTAARLGTSVQAIRQMGAMQQLPLVEAYLGRIQAQYGRLRRPRDLMLAVFYPAYIGAPSIKPFPAAVSRANPGIVTPWSYEQLVRKRSRMPMRAILL